MRIGIDLDDTINNLVDVWLEEYNRDYNDTLKIEDITFWDFAKYVKCENKIYDYLNNGKLFKKVSIKNGVYDSLLKLSKDNELFIVTANFNYGKETCDDKVNFVRKYLPFINVNNIIFISHKYLLNLDLLIDDGIHNLENFKGIKVLFERPWNTSWNSYNYKINKWDDNIVDIINNLKKV